jgi:hypothetical protein
VMLGAGHPATAVDQFGIACRQEYRHE